MCKPTFDGKIDIMKFILILTIFLGYSHLSRSQHGQLRAIQFTIDSLKQIDPDKPEALRLALNSINPAKALNDSLLISYFLDQAGALARQMGKLDTALIMLKESLTYRTDSTDLRGLSITQQNIGKIYVSQGKYDLAAEQFKICLMLMEGNHNLRGQILFSNNIAVVYDLSHKYDQALRYYIIAHEAKEALGDSLELMESHHNLAMAYQHLNDLALARNHQIKALNYSIDLNNKHAEAMHSNSLANIYLDLDASKSARKYLNKALDIYSSGFSPVFMPNTYHYMAIYHQRAKQIDSACFYNDTCITLALELKNLKTLRDAYLLRSDLLEARGELANSLSSARQAMAYEDSLTDAESSAIALEEIKAKYTYEQYQRKAENSHAKITEAKLQSRLNFTIIVAVVAIIAVIVFVFWIIILMRKHGNKRTKLKTAQLVLINKHQSIMRALARQFKASEKKQIIESITPKLTSELKRLTEREMEILSHLALGWTSQEIANHLMTSHIIIKSHIVDLLKKLNLSSKQEAIYLAQSNKIIGSGVTIFA